MDSSKEEDIESKISHVRLVFKEEDEDDENQIIEEKKPPSNHFYTPKQSIEEDKVQQNNSDPLKTFKAAPVDSIIVNKGKIGPVKTSKTGFRYPRIDETPIYNPILDESMSGPTLQTRNQYQVNSNSNTNSNIDSRVDKENIPLLENTESSKTSKIFKSDQKLTSKTKTRNDDDRKGCCCCCCCNSRSSSTNNEMASEFTNDNFRDEFISKILKYKMYQMGFIFFTCLICQVLFFMSKLHESTTTSNRRIGMIFGLIVLMKVYIVLILITRCSTCCQKGTIIYSMYFVQTILLCSFCYGLLLLLSPVHSIIVPITTCNLWLTYMSLKHVFKHNTATNYYCWYCCSRPIKLNGNESSKPVGRLLDVVTPKSYLHLIPILLTTFLCSLLIVLGFLHLILLIFEETAAAVLTLPAIFSLEMIKIYLICFGVVLGVLLVRPTIFFSLVEFCLIRRMISGSSLSLEKDEALYASYFV